MTGQQLSTTTSINGTSQIDSLTKVLYNIEVPIGSFLIINEAGQFRTVIDSTFMKAVIEKASSTKIDPQTFSDRYNAWAFNYLKPDGLNLALQALNAYHMPKEIAEAYKRIWDNVIIKLLYMKNITNQLSGITYDVSRQRSITMAYRACCAAINRYGVEKLQKKLGDKLVDTNGDGKTDITDVQGFVPPAINSSTFDDYAVAFTYQWSQIDGYPINESTVGFDWVLQLGTLPYNSKIKNNAYLGTKNNGIQKYATLYSTNGAIKKLNSYIADFEKDWDNPAKAPVTLENILIVLYNTGYNLSDYTRLSTDAHITKLNTIFTNIHNKVETTNEYTGSNNYRYKFFATVNDNDKLMWTRYWLLSSGYTQADLDEASEIISPKKKKNDKKVNSPTSTNVTTKVADDFLSQ